MKLLSALMAVLLVSSCNREGVAPPDRKPLPIPHRKVEFIIEFDGDEMLREWRCGMSGYRSAPIPLWRGLRALDQEWEVMPDHACGANQHRSST